MSAFHPPDSGSSDIPGATAFFENKVYYFNAGSRGDLYELYNTQPFDDPTTSQWLNGALSEASLGVEPETEVAPAAVVAGGYLYLFWLDSDDDRLMVARLQNGVWSTYSACYDSFGTWIGDAGTAISATALGDDQIIVSTISSERYDNNYWQRQYVFQPSAWNEDKNGKKGLHARYATMYDGNPYQPARFISSAWFSRGGEVDAAGVTQNYLVVSFMRSVPDASHFRSEGHLFQLRSDGGLANPDNKPSKIFYFGDNYRGMALKRDPGGRLRLMSTTWSPSPGATDVPTMRTRLLDTVTLEWGPESIPNGDEDPAYTPAQIEYVYGPATVVDSNVSVRAVREWLFYTGAFKFSGTIVVWRAAEIQCQVADYGGVQRVQTIETVNLTRSSESTPPPNHPQGLWYLRGFIDGPLPLPQANCTKQPDTSVSGNITYGMGQSSDDKQTVTQQWKVGVKSSGEVVIGVGPSWEISASSGTGSSFGTAVSETQSIGLTQASNRDSNDQFLRFGNAYLSELSVSRAQYFFYPTGSAVPSTGAAEWGEARMQLSSPVARQYELFSVTPGDLSSYTTEKWDEWLGPDYNFGSLVIANAVDLDPGDGSSNCLRQSWTLNGGASAGYAASVTQFTESSWSLDKSVWAGVAFDFWGAKGSVLGGFDFSMQSAEATSDGHSWGINCNLQCPNPPPNFGYTAYEYEVYLTKATVEITAFFINKCKDAKLAAMIDPKSASWMLCSRVISSTPNAAITGLLEHGLEPADMERLKLRSMADLCRRYRVATRESILNALVRDRLSDEDRKLLSAYLAWHRANTYVYRSR